MQFFLQYSIGRVGHEEAKVEICLASDELNKALEEAAAYRERLPTDSRDHHSFRVCVKV